MHCKRSTCFRATSPLPGGWSPRSCTPTVGRPMTLRRWPQDGSRSRTTFCDHPRPVPPTGLWETRHTSGWKTFRTIAWRPTDAHASRWAVARTYTSGFFELALRSLKPDGRVGFICADRWMRNQYGRNLRRLVTDGYSLDVSVAMHDVDAFESAVSAYPAVTVLSRRAQRRVVCGRYHILFRACRCSCHHLLHPEPPGSCRRCRRLREHGPIRGLTPPPLVLRRRILADGEPCSAGNDRVSDRQLPAA